MVGEVSSGEHATGGIDGSEKPLAPAQRGLWLMQELNPTSNAYNTLSAFRVMGDIDVERLVMALRGLVRRNQSLRTSFPIGASGAPVLGLHPADDVEVLVHDVRAASNPEKSARDLIDEIQLEPYDLKAGPPVRLAIVHVKPDAAIVLIGAHHIVTDAKSDQILFQQISREFDPEPDAPVDLEGSNYEYSDFAIDQYSHRAATEEGRSIRYWSQRFDGYKGAAKLWPRTNSPEAWGVETNFSIDIPPRLLTSVQHLAQNLRTTPFAVILTTWALAVANREEGRNDIVVGVPVDGRVRRELTDLVGLFVTMIPVRLRIDPSSTFEHAITDTSTSFFEDFAHAGLPLESITRQIATERNAGRTPLIDVTCQLQYSDGSRQALGPYPVERVAPRPQEAKFPLSLSIVFESDQGSGAITYPAELYDPEDIAMLAERFLALLARACEKPKEPVSHIDHDKWAKPTSALDPPDRAAPKESPVPEDETASIRAAVSDCLEDVLGHPLDVNEQFFAVGGHSLLALTAVQRLRTRLDEKLPTNLLFQYGSISSITAYVLSLRADEKKAEVAVGPGPRAKRIREIKNDVGTWLPPLPQEVGDQQSSFVTGGTGLLGRYLIVASLKDSNHLVHCLARGESDLDARRRILQALQSIDGWKPEWASRLIVHRGDLARPQFGLTPDKYRILARTISRVFHVGATTNLLASYEDLYGSNVVGTKQVLRFAATGTLKAVHFVSTASTVRGRPGDPSELPEDWSTDPFALGDSGYVQSKWVAEQTALQSARLGIPVTVYRPSRISPPPSGVTSATSDALWTLLRACIEIGAEPVGAAWEGFGDRIVSAERLGEVIVAQASRPSVHSGPFNIVARELTTLTSMIECCRELGYGIDRVAGKEWVRQLEQAVLGSQGPTPTLSNALLLVQGLSAEPVSAGHSLATANARTVLGDEVLKGFDQEQIRAYIRQLGQSGLVRPPNPQGPEEPPSLSDSPSTFWRLWQQAVARYGSRIAAIDETDALTYTELDRRAGVVSAGLRVMGVGPGSRVGIKLSHRIDLIVAVLAVLRTGAAFVPIDYRDEDARADRILGRAGVVCTVSESSDRTDHTTVSELMVQGDAQPPLEAVEGAVAYILFTSGSTGDPKGVVVSNEALANYLDWVRSEYVSPDRPTMVPLFTSMAFDLTITSLFGPLIAGGAIRLVSADEGVFRVASLLGGGTSFDLLKVTPSHLRILVDVLEQNPPQGTVRAFIVGGEGLPAELLVALRRIYPALIVYNEYGPTEATVGCCVYRLSPQDAVPDPVPIGTAIPRVRLSVVDADGNAVSDGEPGELVIEGQSLAWGYDGFAAQTASAFGAVPAGSGDRRYFTGDIVRYRNDDDVFLYLGRNDQQIKIRGHRVEIDEVRKVVAELSHVVDAVVRVSKLGDDQSLIAYVVLPDTVQVAPGDLHKEVKRRVPQYMVPDAFIIVPKIPVNRNGKVDWKRLQS